MNLVPVDSTCRVGGTRLSLVCRFVADQARGICSRAAANQPHVYGRYGGGRGRSGARKQEADHEKAQHRDRKRDLTNHDVSPLKLDHYEWTVHADSNGRGFVVYQVSDRELDRGSGTL